MASQTLSQNETRSSRRRAAHDELNPERRMNDASRSEARRSPPSLRPQRPSRRDRSRSPADPDRVYRTREAIAVQPASQIGVSLAFRTRSSARRTIDSDLDARHQRAIGVANPTETCSGVCDPAVLGIEREKAARLVSAAAAATSATLKDLTASVDSIIRETVVASDEQASIVAAEASSADFEEMRADLEHVTIHDRDPRTSIDQSPRILTQEEELIKREEQTFVDAVWLDEYPFLLEYDG